MTERISSSQFRAMAGEQKPSKYRNKRVTVDGIKFASKAEAKYYGDLKQRERAGEVHGVEMQRRFALLGADGTLMATYVADFCFWDSIEDRFRCIDVKGFETKEFKIKRKMMKGLLGINVEVVK